MSVLWHTGISFRWRFWTILFTQTNNDIVENGGINNFPAKREEKNMIKVTKRSTQSRRMNQHLCDKAAHEGCVQLRSDRLEKVFMKLAHISLNSQQNLCGGTLWTCHGGCLRGFELHVSLRAPVAWFGYLFHFGHPMKALVAYTMSLFVCGVI